MTSLRRHSQPGFCAKHAGAMALAWLLTVALAPAAENRDFAIPAGDATLTLREYAEQSGEQVVFLVNKVRGVSTHPVRGKVEARAALEQMLAGTELYSIEDPTTAAIVINRVPRLRRERDGFRRDAPARSPEAPASSDSVVKLPTFTLHSERDSSYFGREALSTTRTGVELGDLPQSVVVMNRAFINDINPTILAKALNYVGGAQTGTIIWSVDRYMIRGFVGEGDYVDGFRTQTDKNTNFNLIDHVEVIKGPTAIFVSNQALAVGGVINKISKSPPGYPVATLGVQLGLWDANRADLDVGGPADEHGRLRWRLLLSGQDSRGYYDATYEKRTSVLPMVAYRVSEHTEAWVKFETFSSHYSAYNGLPLDGRTNAILAVPATRNLNEDTPRNWRTDRFTRLWAQVTTRPADFLAIRLAGFDSRDRQRRVESILMPTGATFPTMGDDGIGRFLPHPQYVIPPTYLPGATIPRTVTAINADEQPRRELQHDYVLTFGQSVAAHQLLLGGALIEYPQTTRTYSSGATSTATTTAIDPFAAPQAGGVFVDFSRPPVNTTHRSQRFAKLYALETVSLWDRRVVLSFGASRHRYGLAMTSAAHNQRSGTDGPVTSVPRQVLYKNLVQYGLVVKPWRHVSLFYGYNKNFSSNGIQLGQLLPPQEGEQREVGLKAEWLNGRFRAGVNHFEVTQLNNAVPAFPQTTPPSNVLVPGTVSRGVDGDLTAELTPQLDVIGSFAWFDAHVPLAAPFDRALQPYDQRVHRALPVNNVSEHNLAVWMRYKFSGPLLKGWSVGGGASFLDRRAITDNSNSILYGYVPRRTLADAVIAFETRNARYQLNIDNVFNADYIYSSRSNQVIVPGSPLNFRAVVTYKW